MHYMNGSMVTLVNLLLGGYSSLDFLIYTVYNIVVVIKKLKIGNLYVRRITIPKFN